ncbi:MAG: sugar ABC transporter permease [Microbacterium sp.]|uniref:carbohydrate ABC transporter permease n=1 Tax=Microbacterium sp. TaxID=51671 RepID=UPI0039E2D842
MTISREAGLLTGSAVRGRSSSRTAGPAPGRPRSRRRLYLLWFSLPAILLVAFFFAGPFVANGVLSFTKWTGYSNTISFNGLDNFTTLASLGVLGHATIVTLLFALITMVAQNAFGLALGKALQQTDRVNTVFRSIFFLPVLFSPLAAGYIWSAILSPDGPVNAVIGLVIPGFSHSWLGDSSTALLAVGLVDAWKWSGLVTLVYISGLNGIPRSVVEASVLDGAGPWRRFRSVEFPLLAPAMTFNVVVTLVGSLSALDVIFATTKGGPGDATSVLNVAVYTQYGQGLFGTSSALSFIIALMAIVIAVPLIWWLRKREVHA